MIKGFSEYHMYMYLIPYKEYGIFSVEFMSNDIPVAIEHKKSKTHCLYMLRIHMIDVFPNFNKTTDFKNFTQFQNMYQVSCKKTNILNTNFNHKFMHAH